MKTIELTDEEVIVVNQALSEYHEKIKNMNESQRKTAESVKKKLQPPGND